MKAKIFFVNQFQNFIINTKMEAERKYMSVNQFYDAIKKYDEHAVGAHVLFRECESDKFDKAKRNITPLFVIITHVNTAATQINFEKLMTIVPNLWRIKVTKSSLKDVTKDINKKLISLDIDADISEYKGFKYHKCSCHLMAPMTQSKLPQLESKRNEVIESIYGKNEEEIKENDIDELELAI